MSRSPTAEAIALALALLVTTGAAAQVSPEEARADAAAQAALPRAVIRTIRSETRTIQGLSGGLAANARTISGDITAIAGAQKALAGSGLAMRVVGGGLELSLPGDVLFDFDQATLRQSAVPTLERVRLAVTQTGDRPVRVEGHTDSVGTAAHNQPLSEARAKTVAGWLSRAGVAPSRIVSAGYGATRPVVPNTRSDGRDDPAGRQRNRRVTIIL